MPGADERQLPKWPLRLVLSLVIVLDVFFVVMLASWFGPFLPDPVCANSTRRKGQVNNHTFFGVDSKGFSPIIATLDLIALNDSGMFI